MYCELLWRKLNTFHLVGTALFGLFQQKEILGITGMPTGKDIQLQSVCWIICTMNERLSFIGLENVPSKLNLCRSQNQHVREKALFCRECKGLNPLAW